MHDHFTQAITAGDEHHTVKAGFGVQREHHPADPDIAAHHALQGCGQGKPGLVKVFMAAIGNGAIVVERGVNGLDLLQHGVNTADVQEGFLLPGKGGLRQVFRRGRGSDRDGYVPLPVGGHGCIGRDNGLL